MKKYNMGSRANFEKGELTSLTAGDLYTKEGLRTLPPTMTYLKILLFVAPLEFFLYSFFSFSPISSLSLSSFSFISPLFIFSFLSKVMLKREPFINIQLSLHIFVHMCEKRSIQGKLMQKK